MLNPLSPVTYDLVPSYPKSFITVSNDSMRDISITTSVFRNLSYFRARHPSLRNGQLVSHFVSGCLYFGGNLLYNPLTALDSVHGTRRFFLLRDALSPLSSLPKICFYLVKFRITLRGTQKLQAIPVFFNLSGQ